MADKIQSFEQLAVWNEAIELAASIYQLTKRFPSSEQFALTNQIRRSVSSVPANIAEGFGRQGQKEKIQFYSIAYGSLLETKSFLYLANRLAYCSETEIKDRLTTITQLQKQLNSLIRSVKNSD